MRKFFTLRTCSPFSFLHNGCENGSSACLDALTSQCTVLRKRRKAQRWQRNQIQAILF